MDEDRLSELIQAEGVKRYADIIALTLKERGLKSDDAYKTAVAMILKCMKAHGDDYERLTLLYVMLNKRFHISRYNVEVQVMIDEYALSGDRTELLKFAISHLENMMPAILINRDINQETEKLVRRQIKAYVRSAHYYINMGNINDIRNIDHKIIKNTIGDTQYEIDLNRDMLKIRRGTSTKVVSIYMMLCEVAVSNTPMDRTFTAMRPLTDDDLSFLKKTFEVEIKILEKYLLAR